ncbi:hypothetical protein, partial [Saccharothrix longispora]|uniref:hypothetical protein n=1 Tax=Saccharothrix longispora TaxID=33920 RepID=UPI0028FD3ECE
MSVAIGMTGFGVGRNRRRGALGGCTSASVSVRVSVPRSRERVSGTPGAAVSGLVVPGAVLVGA